METTITHLRAEKDKMEQTILKATSIAMSEFHANTGLSTNAIYINLVDITQLDAREKWYGVHSVRADILV